MQDKRGQVTLFVIIAIVIVAIVLLAVFLIPKINKPETPETESIEPEVYISSCINDELEPLVEKISNQGGYLEKPELWIFYKENYVGYLCYTDQNNQVCSRQAPFLKTSAEEQLKKELLDKKIVSNCINAFSSNAIKKGYQSNVCTSPQFSVVLVSGQVTIPIICDMTLVKENTKKFTNITSVLNWPLYDFIMVSNEIIEDEIAYNKFEQLAYMLVHPWISIDIFSAEGNRIYSLKEVSTSKTFMFAVRNNVQSPGL